MDTSRLVGKEGARLEGSGSWLLSWYLRALLDWSLAYVFDEDRDYPSASTLVWKCQVEKIRSRA